MCIRDSYNICKREIKIAKITVEESHMLNILAVGFGGFIGSVFRYFLGLFINSIFRQSAFPYGTLSANILGCLIIGILSGLVDHASPSQRQRASSYSQVS